MHQVARYAQNREWRIEIYHSCNKLHATHKIVNYTSRFIIRATSCTLRTKSWITHIEVNYSCNKFHATHKIVNYALRFIIRRSRYTLRTKSWITHRGLSFVQQVARYARNRELRIEVNHSCNKLHATHDIMNYTLRLIIHALAGYNSKVRWNFTALFLLFHT